MNKLDELIEQGNELMNTDVGSPAFGVWRDDVRAAVAPYGESMMSVANRALNHGAMVYGGRNTNDEVIQKTIELLQLLKKRQPEDMRARDVLISQKQAEATATLQSKFGNITVQGDATFGDSSPITKVTVGELMASLISEVEDLPESDSKNQILDGLKGVLANPTFAAVAGTMIPELVKKLMGG